VYESLGSLSGQSIPIPIPTRVIPSPGPRSSPSPSGTRATPSPGPYGRERLSRSISMRPPAARPKLSELSSSVREKKLVPRASVSINGSKSTPTTPVGSKPTSPSKQRPQLTRKERSTSISGSLRNSITTTKEQMKQETLSIDEELEAKLQKKIKMQIEKSKAQQNIPVEVQEEEQFEEDVKVELIPQQLSPKRKKKTPSPELKKSTQTMVVSPEIKKNIQIDQSPQKHVESENIKTNGNKEENSDFFLKKDTPKQEKANSTVTIKAEPLNVGGALEQQLISLNEKYAQLMNVVGNLVEQNRNGWNQMDQRVNTLEEMVTGLVSENRKTPGSKKREDNT